METFQIYFELGLEHILDVNGYDHILFVIALSSIYLIRDWKKILILVTAFTIGHSVTLALATLRVINFRIEIIEFLIPITIFLTAVSNLSRTDATHSNRKIQTNYWLALAFGFIHGLGFSTYLRSLLGTDRSILNQLLAFNIGLEVGQIIIVAAYLIISFIFVSVFQFSRRDWKMVVSSAIAGIAITIMLEAKFW